MTKTNKIGNRDALFDFSTVEQISESLMILSGYDNLMETSLEHSVYWTLEFINERACADQDAADFMAVLNAIKDKLLKKPVYDYTSIFKEQEE